jgi:hypothetical protein
MSMLPINRADLLRYQRMPYRERLFAEPHRSVIEAQRQRMAQLADMRAKMIGYRLPGPDLMLADILLSTMMIEADYKTSSLVDGALPPDLWPARDTTYCECLHQECGSPLWVLEGDLARSLSETEPPIDVVTEGLLETSLRLPYPALFVVTPPVFDILDTHQGTLHALEGFFVAEVWGLSDTARDRIKMSKDPATHVDLRNTEFSAADFSRGLVVVAAGKAIGAMADGNLDDCVLTVTIGAGGKPNISIQSDQHRKVWAMAMNFVLALNGGYLDTRRVKAQKRAKETKKEKKLRAAIKQGQIQREHVLVSLSRMAQQARNDRISSGEHSGAQKRPHWVRGHWHSYWMKKDPEKLLVQETQDRDGVPWSRCLRWIMPYLTGMGVPDHTPTYKVVR